MAKMGELGLPPSSGVYFGQLLGALWLLCWLCVLCCAVPACCVGPALPAMRAGRLLQLGRPCASAGLQRPPSLLGGACHTPTHHPCTCTRALQAWPTISHLRWASMAMVLTSACLLGGVGKWEGQCTVGMGRGGRRAAPVLQHRTLLDCARVLCVN